MVLSREGFLSVKRIERKAELIRSHAGEGIPDDLLDAWAEHNANKDWLSTRVYDEQARLEAVTVNQHGHTATGVGIHINPGGNLSQTIQMSLAEFRELIIDGKRFLEVHGEWKPDDEGHFQGYPSENDGGPAGRRRPGPDQP